MKLNGKNAKGSSSPGPTLLDLGDDELRKARAEAESAVAAVEVKLAGVRRDAAEALTSTAVDPTVLERLSAGRAQLERERERAIAKVTEVEVAVASYKRRSAAKSAIDERIKENSALVAEAKRGNLILQRVLDVLREADAEMPWRDSGTHPGGHRHLVVKENVELDAEDAEIAAPALEAPPVFDLYGEIQRLASSLAKRNELLPHVGGKVTRRGQQREREAFEARRREAEVEARAPSSAAM